MAPINNETTRFREWFLGGRSRCINTITSNPMSVKPKHLTKIIFISLIIIAIAMYFSTQSSLSNKHSLDVIKAKTATESQVIRVVDGDTIIVALNHKPETIRLLGVNTPETVAPNKPVQCYGPEASKHVKELLTDKVVQLESDPSQDNKDKYHRLLRYVLLENTNVNESLVIDGYAREYTFKIPYKYQKQFRADQKLAKKNRLGLWGVCFPSL